MGIFGSDNKDKNVKNDKKSSVQDDVVLDETTGIDFTKYDLTSLGDDVRSIVSLPDAMAQTAKWAIGIPIAIGIACWIIFSGRMASWVFVPFVLGAMALSVIGSVFIGGFFVARRRLDTISDATSRVVHVVGEMHRDVVQLKDGASTTSVKAVASGLLEHAVFPVAFGFVEGMAPTGSTGMLGRIGSRFTSAPMKLVQKSTLAAIDRLPDKQIGQMTNNLTDAMPEVAATIRGLNDEYQRIAGDIEGVVAGVSKATLSSVIGAASLSMMPLLVWLLIGWVAS